MEFDNNGGSMAAHRTKIPTKLTSLDSKHQVTGNPRPWGPDSPQNLERVVHGLDGVDVRQGNHNVDVERPEPLKP